MPRNIAVIGSGLTALGFLQGLSTQIAEGKISGTELTVDVFDAFSIGAGLPYDPATTDIEHLLNVRATQASATDDPKNFHEWLNNHFYDADGALVSNRENIKKALRKIFDERLQEKFQKRFGIDYEKEKRGEYVGPQKELCEHYDNIWSSLEKRYLNFRNGAEFHPRAVFGLYNMAMFRLATDKLEEAGVTINLHPHTEVSSLTRASDDAADTRSILKFNSSSLTANDVIFATGRWRDKPETQSDHYLSTIWPVADLRKNLDKLIAEEIAKREAVGNSDREIRIAIEGSSLSAIDIVKTINRDGVFNRDADGTLTYIPDAHAGYSLKVDMISRSGTMNKVKGKMGWWQADHFKDGATIKYPDGIVIEQKMLESLATEQEGKMRLWQVMVMTARATEIAYQKSSEVALAAGNSEEAETALRAAAVARGFLVTIISNLKKDDVGAAIFADDVARNKFFDELKGDAKAQLKEMMDVFHLQLDGANYVPILDSIKVLTGNDGLEVPGAPLRQLRSDLAAAKNGDVGGFLVWQNIYNQVDSLTMRHLLNTDEELYRFQILDRFHESLTNGMPQISAEEMLALNEAGILDVKAMGRDLKKYFVREVGGEIIYELASERAKRLQEMQAAGIPEAEILLATKDVGVAFGANPATARRYDIAVNTMGHSANMNRNPPPLYKSMADVGLITTREIEWSRGAAEYEGKKQSLVRTFGASDADTMLRSVAEVREEDRAVYNSGVIKMGEGNSLPLNPHIVMAITAGGIGGARKQGVRAAGYLATLREIPVPSPTVTSGAAVDGSAVAVQRI